MNEILNLNSVNSDINAVDFILCMATALLLSLLTTAHFKRFPNTVSSKSTIAILLPFIALVVCVIITTVKSSLALSLGLVGALSIVRFRTPIKDPIELSYIFLAIAIGLGSGAGQLQTVTIGTLIILVAMAVYIRMSNKVPAVVYLSVNISDSDFDTYNKVSELLSKYLSHIDIRKFSFEDRTLDMVVLAPALSIEETTQLTSDLVALYPSSNLTILDTSDLPQV